MWEAPVEWRGVGRPVPCEECEKSSGRSPQMSDVGVAWHWPQSTAKVQQVKTLYYLVPLEPEIVQ